MDRVTFYSVFLASIYQTDAVIRCGTCLQPPNYVSSYVRLKSQSIHSEAIIELNITEVPIKVDIQVRPISGNDTAYVFSGLGSSQQDDDKRGEYGGVVYKYNETTVRLYVPNRNDNSGDGTVIFTGNSDAWFGPKQQKEDEAEVRVRVWTECNFPAADYESNWFHMKVQNGTDSFREIRHDLGYAPDYVTVQVWNNGTNWYSDGIASGMTPNNVKKETAWGGVVYAYNDRFVRVWVPGFDTGRMFSVADGWGRGSQETWSEGMVKVRVWGNMPGDSVYKSTATIGQITRGNLTSQLRSVTRSLDKDTGLISVTLKALNGNNNGYSFPTLGAVQNTDPGDKFGGVVYSYSSNGIRIWHPIVPGGGNTALYTKGSIIYLSPYWGGGSFSQDSKNGLVEVRFWNSYTGQCPPPTTPAKASTSPFTGTTSNMSRPHSTPLTTRTTSRLTTSFLPITSVPVLTSTTARSATVTSTSTKSTASTSRTSFHAQSSRHVSTAIPSTRTSSGGHSGANSKTVSRSVGTTTGFRGSKATTSSTILTGTGGTNSQATRSTLRDGQDGQDDGGLSPVATGLIATASILSAACCLSGLIFGLLKKMKRKQEVDPEIENNDAFGSQKAIEDKRNPATNNGTSPKDDGTHPSSTTDNGIPSPENGSPPTGNGSPPVDTGSPQIATDRPQTARPE